MRPTAQTALFRHIAHCFNALHCTALNGDLHRLIRVCVPLLQALFRCTQTAVMMPDFGEFMCNFCFHVILNRVHRATAPICSACTAA